MTSWVGHQLRPLDWDQRTKGAVQFATDLQFEGLLYASVLRSPYPHARVRRVDTSRASAMTGVHAVITADDFRPDALYVHRGAPLSDRPPLARDAVRFVGQEIAAVAADTQEIADAAVHAIRVKLRRLRGSGDVRQARTRRAGTLHRRMTDERNVALHWHGSWGDSTAALSAAQFATTGRYRYPSVSHAPMEPNVAIAQWHASGWLELWVSTQAPWFVAKEVAQLLDLRHEQVVCREVEVGGGFGAKSKANEHEVLAAKLSMRTGRPVVLQLSRSDEFSFSKPRHAFETELTVAGDESGNMTYFGAEVVVDNGAYNHMGSSVLRNGMMTTIGSMYRPMGADFDGRLVDTATTPGGQFRGYGTPQIAFALESEIDEFAAAVGVDPVEIRRRNVNHPNSTTLSGSRVGTAALDDCITAAASAIHWQEKRARRRPGRGVGIAAGMHGSGAYAYEGANESEAAVDLSPSGTLRIRYGGADPGTGQRTILAQLAADELGVDPSRISVQSMDSEQTPFDQGAWSSRGTQMAGSAVKQAASEMAEHLRTIASDKLGNTNIELKDGRAWGNGSAIEIGDLVPLSDRSLGDSLTFRALYTVDGTEMLQPGKDTVNVSPSYSFAAHAAEVEVDEQTGEVRLIDYVAAHDSGVAINPTLVESQIIGGAVMGIGTALGEELIRTDGRVANNSYTTYALPRAADVCDVRAVIVESSEPRGPRGAKSVGEMSIIPCAPAIANAVFDAIGIRFHELPITPDRVLAAIATRDHRAQPRHRIWRRPNRWWVSLVRRAYPWGAHAVLHHFGVRFARKRPTLEVQQLIEPVNLVDALARLDEDAVALAGGTDLLQRCEEGLVSPVRFVSVASLGELREITSDDDGALRIGAAVTLHQLEEDERLPGLIRAACTTIATPQVRAVATVAGNLLQEKRCWYFRSGFDCYKRSGPTCPCYAVLGDHRFYHASIGAHRCQAVTPSDLATALIALDCDVEIKSAADSRVVRSEDLYSGPGESIVRPDELLTSVRTPASAGSRAGAFKKLSLYDGGFALVSVALSARMDGGHLRDMRLVLGGIAPIPWRARSTEDALDGVSPCAGELRPHLTRELERRAHPLPNNGWKLDAAVGLAEQALTEIAAASSVA